MPKGPRKDVLSIIAGDDEGFFSLLICVTMSSGLGVGCSLKSLMLFFSSIAVIDAMLDSTAAVIPIVVLDAATEDATAPAGKCSASPLPAPDA
jgi:hypothetical protein